MANKFNPFKPNHPIYEGLFAGRYNEIKKIDNALFQTSFGNPINLLITGERGIGKTSLLLLAKYFAQGYIIWEEKKHNFLTIQLNIDKKTNTLDFFLKFKNKLRRELNRIYKTHKIIDEIWGFLQKLEISGFKIKDSHIENSLLVDNFIYSLIDTLKSIRSDINHPKEGIVVLIDESDTASDELNLGSLLKNLSEILVSENQNNILFILAGLPHLTDVLRKSHESSPRLFEEINIGPLSIDDTRHVIKQAETQINNFYSSKNYRFTAGAVDSFHNYSEGYPHFLQQIGFSTIEFCDNNTIREKDVSNAMFARNGALELIGKRYYTDLFYNKINVDSYRKILEIMSENWNEWISKKEIRKSFKGSDITLNNGLKALRDRHIILTKQGVRGKYRLQWMSFAFWIKIHKSTVN